MEDYAAFRAAWDARKAPWPTWPAPARDGLLREGDFGGQAKRYHLFVQWALHLQLRELSSGPRKLLYLDLPLGASYDGYDVWRRRDLFALEASAGAPPDDFFTKGQDWGFPPLHPERSREEGHAYFRECLANQLRYAGTLRIDHVMGLHRFFWIPKGAGPAEGTYVRYPAEELYAVACLESVRHRARIVGEDLGTVPRYVRPAMARHGILRMFVAQFGLSPDPRRALGGIPRACVASVNTHDMPTFASFWKRIGHRRPGVAGTPGPRVRGPGEGRAREDRPGAFGLPGDRRKDLGDARGFRTGKRAAGLPRPPGGKSRRNGDRRPGGPLAGAGAAEHAGHLEGTPELDAENPLPPRGNQDAARGGPNPGGGRPAPPERRRETRPDTTRMTGRHFGCTIG